MKYDIPGVGLMELNTVVLDLNGTLSVGGKIVPGVHERIRKLKNMGFKVLFFTGNTRGDAVDISDELCIGWVYAKDGNEKKLAGLKLSPDTLVSIGNGRIDVELMKIAKLRIITLQGEGVYIPLREHCDIETTSINDALDLLLDPHRLIATLRA